MRRGVTVITLVVVGLPAANNPAGGAGLSHRVPVAQPRAEIAFDRTLREGGTSNIYAVAADGTAPHLLLRNGHSPAASRDGAHLAFVRGRAIWVASRDGTSQRRLTSPPKSGEGDDEPAWSPDGRRIYFTRDDRNFDLSLFVVDSAGSGLRRLHYSPPTNHGDCDKRPAVTPDGSMIAFGKSFDCEHGSDLHIIAVNANGKSARLRIRWPSENVDLIEFDPAWSADGALAYVTVDVDAQSNPPFAAGWGGLYTSRPGGAAPRRLLKSGSVADPAWSPDHRWLAYVNGHRIDIVDRNGAHRRQLTTFPGRLGYPCWLPGT